MESVVEESYFEIVGSKKATSVGVISIEGLLNRKDIFFVELRADVEIGVKLWLLLATGKTDMGWASAVLLMSTRIFPARVLLPEVPLGCF